LQILHDLTLANYMLHYGIAADVTPFNAGPVGLVSKLNCDYFYFIYFNGSMTVQCQRKSVAHLQL